MTSALTHRTLARRWIRYRPVLVSSADDETDRGVDGFRHVVEVARSGYSELAVEVVDLIEGTDRSTARVFGEESVRPGRRSNGSPWRSCERSRVVRSSPGEGARRRADVPLSERSPAAAPLEEVKRVARVGWAEGGHHRAMGAEPPGPTSQRPHWTPDDEAPDLPRQRTAVMWVNGIARDQLEHGNCYWCRCNSAQALEALGMLDDTLRKVGLPDPRTLDPRVEQRKRTDGSGSGHDPSPDRPH